MVLLQTCTGFGKAMFDRDYGQSQAVSQSFLHAGGGETAAETHQKLLHFWKIISTLVMGSEILKAQYCIISC